MSTSTLTRRICPLALALVLVPIMAFGADRAPWSQEIIDLVTTLPVQDGGRIKPFDTFAQFTMLQLNGKRSFTTKDGERLKPVPWMLDVLFYPASAATYQHFVVDNYDVVSAMGVDIHDKRRSRYSYEELEAGIPTLMDLARKYSAIERKKRNLVQQGVLDLSSSIFLYTQLIHYLDFTQERFTVTGDSPLAQAFPEKDGVPLSVALERAAAVLAKLKGNPDNLDNDAVTAVVADFSTLFEKIEGPAMRSQAIALFPPPQPDVEAWQTPADIVSVAISGDPGASDSLSMLGELEKLAGLRDDRPAFTIALATLHDDIVNRATKRGEYSKIPLEVSYYKGNYIFYSQWLFLLSFVLVAISWLMPRSKWIHYVTPLAVSVPLLLLIIGITMRCIIRERPPISTLY